MGNKFFGSEKPPVFNMSDRINVLKSIKEFENLEELKIKEGKKKIIKKDLNNIEYKFKGFKRMFNENCVF